MFPSEAFSRGLRLSQRELREGERVGDVLLSANPTLFQDLNRLGRDLKRVVIIDNSPASYAFHPDNAVSHDHSPPVPGFSDGGGPI